MKYAEITQGKMVDYMPESYLDIGAVTLMGIVNTERTNLTRGTQQFGSVVEYVKARTEVEVKHGVYYNGIISDGPFWRD